MIGFTKRESLFVFVVLVGLVGATLVNLSNSYRKSRDNVRKNALGDIEARIGEFKSKVGQFPASTDDGVMIGCDGFWDKLGQWVFKECNWGPNEVNSPFFNPLPTDPYADRGVTFKYFSNGETYQIFTSIEGSGEDEYDPQIKARNIMCGTAVCTAGRTNSYPDTLYSPLPPASQ